MSDENSEFVRALFGGPEPASPETDEETTGFDGGVRSPAAEPEDPEQAHNAFIAELARRANLGQMADQ